MKTRFPLTNLFLFLATILTTHWAGAVMAGAVPGDPIALLLGSVDLKLVFSAGWTFAVPLLLALGTHEMGHFIVARAHGLDPSWPYFLPVPLPPVGTFGAVIRMRLHSMPSSRAMFDVGIAGPLAGFVVSVICLYLGARWSTVVPDLGDLQTFSLLDAIRHWLQTGSAELFPLVADGRYLLFGDSLLVRFLIETATGHPSDLVNLHPVAFAGWVGLFVTLLNLMPVGQLDGGHVASAILGKRTRFLPLLVIPLLIVLGFVGWLGWFVWAGVVAFIGFRHPPIEGEPLGFGRLLLAWLCLLIFVLIFTPVPIQTAW